MLPALALLLLILSSLTDAQNNGTCTNVYPFTDTTISTSSSTTALYDPSGVIAALGRYLVSGPQSLTLIDSTQPACTSTAGNTSRSVTYTGAGLIPAGSTFSLRWTSTQTVYADCSSNSYLVGSGYAMTFTTQPFTLIKSGATSIAGFGFDQVNTDGFALTFDWANSCGQGKFSNLLCQLTVPNASAIAFCDAANSPLTTVQKSANTTYYNLITWDGSAFNYYIGTSYDALTLHLSYTDPNLMNIFSGTIFVGTTAEGCANMQLSIGKVFIAYGCSTPCLLAGCGEWPGGNNEFISTCASATGSSRSCQCASGYGIKASLPSEVVTSPVTPASPCLDVDECVLWGCGVNSLCSTTSVVDQRTCTCKPGHVINATDPLVPPFNVVGQEVVVGQVTWEKCLVRRNLCAMFTCGTSATCSQTAYNTRRCTCNAGYTNGNSDGSSLVGGVLPLSYVDFTTPTTSAASCNYDIKECTITDYNCSGVDPGKSTTGSCVEQSTVNARNCTCPSGFSPPWVYVSGAQITTPFQGCYAKTLCQLYGCGNGNNVTCTDIDTWTRSCICDSGFSGSKTSLLTNEPFTGCYDTNECDLYGCGNYTASCLNQFDQRTCYCPPGTTPRNPAFTSEVLIQSANATIICDDIDECALYGCPDVIGYQATCTTDADNAGLNARTCTCHAPLLGTTTLYGNETFKGCKVPAINIKRSHTLGFTLADGFWIDWKEVIPVDIDRRNTTGYERLGPLADLFATTDSKHLVGWMQASFTNSTGVLEISWTNRFTSSTSQVCNGAFTYLYDVQDPEKRPSFVCLNEFGDLVVFTLVTGDTTLQKAVTINAGDQSLIVKQTETASWYYSANSTYVLINQGQTIVDLYVFLDTELGQLVKTQEFPVTYDVPPPTPEITFPTFADLDGSGRPGLVFIHPATKTFYWYAHGPNSTHFNRVGWLQTTQTPTRFVLIDYDLDGKLDLVAVTSNCYAMFQIPHIFSQTGNLTGTIPPTFDGNCDQCGCGFSTGLISADLNADNQPDLIVSLSGGAQILLNKNGVFDPQKILGGASVSNVYDMDHDGDPDIIAITSGISVWYEVTPPLACEENVHSCDANQTCVTQTWNAPLCVCRKGYIANSTGFCVDEDECLRTGNNSVCEQNCTNTIGSYICSCSTGFNLRSDGSCIDVPECLTKKPCSSRCVEIPGSYYCECPSGYQLIPTTDGSIPHDCDDINECNNATLNTCDPAAATCKNTIGSYECTCFAGYIRSSQFQCIEKPCVWDNWEDWTNGDCFTPETRTRYPDPSSGSPNYACTREANTEWHFNFTQFCPYPTKPPTSLFAAAKLIAKYVSDFYLDVVFPFPTQGLFPYYNLSNFTYNYSTPGLIQYPLRRMQTDIAQVKRAILPGDPSAADLGIFFYGADNCDPAALAVAAADMHSFVSYILAKDPSKIIVKTNVILNGTNLTEVVYNLTDLGLLSAGNATFYAWSALDNATINLTASNCTIILDITPAYRPDYTAIYIAVPIAVVALIMAIIAGIYYYKHHELKKALKVLESLPKVLTKHYRNAIKHPEQWEILEHDPPLYRKLLTDLEDTNHVMEIFRKLDGHKIRVDHIYAVYNPSLVTAMALTREKFENRVLHDAALFYAEKWKNDQVPRVILKRRQWVKDTFIKRVAEFSWNHELAVPIVPTIHGTAAAVAWKICHGGFATLSSLDIGFFGAGIYFTTSAKYAIPYFATKAQPAIIISYLVPGNPYPVIENPNQEGSLAGEVIKAGYQSHYVLTTNRGMPFEKVEYKNIFDEIVVDQESQVAPAYVLLLDNKGFPALIRDFEKRTSEDDSANEDYDR